MESPKSHEYFPTPCTDNPMFGRLCYTIHRCRKNSCLIRRNRSPTICPVAGKRDAMTHQIIKRGLLQSFDPSSYTATVLILEATSYSLAGVPIATSVDGTSALAGAPCAVLFFDEQNTDDAVVLAIYGKAPSPSP